MSEWSAIKNSKLIVLSVFVLLFMGAKAFSCEPDEIFVRSHRVKAHSKKDGTLIREYLRKGHCREIRSHNYFSNNRKQKFKNVRTNLKKWKTHEVKIIKEVMETLPKWLKRYKLNEILRADVFNGVKLNPAATIPKSKTLIVFNNFFERTNKRDVLIHELSHIAVYDFEPLKLEEFFISSGWKYDKNKKLKSPVNPLLKDSIVSPSEDFANHVQIYYSNPSLLKKHNFKSYLLLKKMISKKENRK